MIEAQIDARNFGKYGSGFAVVMNFQKHNWRRSFNCGKITGNQAELRAVEFILRSIKKEFKNEPVLIKSSGRYAQLMLEITDGRKWKRETKANAEVLAELREVFLKFSDVKIEYHDDLVGVKALCEDAVRRGRLVDERI